MADVLRRSIWYSNRGFVRKNRLRYSRERALHSFHVKCGKNNLQKLANLIRFAKICGGAVAGFVQELRDRRWLHQIVECPLEPTRHFLVRRHRQLPSYRERAALAERCLESDVGKAGDFFLEPHHERRLCVRLISFLASTSFETCTNEYGLLSSDPR